MLLETAVGSWTRITVFFECPNKYRKRGKSRLVEILDCELAGGGTFKFKLKSCRFVERPSRSFFFSMAIVCSPEWDGKKLSGRQDAWPLGALFWQCGEYQVDLSWSGGRIGKGFEDCWVRSSRREPMGECGRYPRLVRRLFLYRS